jgi:peptidoglycan/LPS O-acetylase OafA/YrhL
MFASQQATRKIDELESIRGLAAVLVVLFHVPAWNAALYGINFIRNGDLMVQLFFVLSGFVIYRAYAQRIQRDTDLFQFELLRVGRLYPVHLLFLLLFLGIESAKLVTSGGSRSAPFLQNSPIAFIEQLLLVQAIGPTGNTYTFNEPAWSISVEFWTCALFAVLVLTLKRRALFAFAAIGVAALACIATRTTGSYLELLLCCGGFFLGCCCAAFAARVTVSIHPLFATLATLALLIFLQLQHDPSSDLGIYVLTALVLLTMVVSGPSRLKQALRSRPLTWLGEVSYSVYMSHSFILYIASQLLRRVLKKPETLVGGQLVVQLSLAEAIVASALVVAATLLLSTVIYKTIEKPCRDWSRRFVARPESTRTPAAA